MKCVVGGRRDQGTVVDQELNVCDRAGRLVLVADMHVNARLAQSVRRLEVLTRVKEKSYMRRSDSFVNFPTRVICVN